MTASAPVTSSSAAAVSRPSSSGSAAASTTRRTTASSASAGEPMNSPVPGWSSRARAASTSLASRAGAQLEERRAGLLERAQRQRARAGARRQPPERQLAERRLIALAEQIEDVRALREVVVALGGVAAKGRDDAADAKEFSPRARRGSRVDLGRHQLEAPAALLRGVRRRTKASVATRCAWTSSAGGTPGDATIASASSIARANWPRRSASRASIRRSDQSYQRGVCAS